MKKLFASLTALLLFTALLAQEEFIEPAQPLTKFKFSQLTGGIIILKGHLDPFPDTLNFILDTGSGGISIDSARAVKFGLKGIPSNRIIRGIAGIRSVSFINNRKLHLPGLSIDSLNFHINDYDILTSVYGDHIDGIIGYSVLSRYIVKINYDSSVIEFWTKGAIKYPRGGHMLNPILNTLPFQTAKVRDERTINTRFLFDLGAGLNMIFSSDFINDSNLLKKNKKLYAKEAEGLGGKVDMQMTVIREVKLGPYKFRKVPVYIFDDDYNVTSYPFLGGIMGNDLLRRFNVILNYDQKEIYLMPNSYFHSPFDYSYSGIELYKVNGAIILGDVASGSPAEKAGLLEGDIVLAINNDFTQNMAQYKTALQDVGERIIFIIRRGTELKQVSFRVARLRH